MFKSHYIHLNFNDSQFFLLNSIVYRSFVFFIKTIIDVLFVICFC